jgi:hypothetical protein
MSRLTLQDANANSVSLMTLLKAKGASHITLREDSCRFYEKPTQGEYYLIDVYMPNGQGGYCYTVSNNGKVSFSLTHYNNSYQFEQGHVTFLPVLEKWVANKEE